MILGQKLRLLAIHSRAGMSRAGYAKRRVAVERICLSLSQQAANQSLNVSREWFDFDPTRGFVDVELKRLACTSSIVGFHKLKIERFTVEVLLNFIIFIPLYFPSLVNKQTNIEWEIERESRVLFNKIEKWTENGVDWLSSRLLASFLQQTRNHKSRWEWKVNFILLAWRRHRDFLLYVVASHRWNFRLGHLREINTPCFFWFTRE